MARLQLGRSRCQIVGGTVPAGEFSLAVGDSIFFPHHTLLWTDPATELSAMPLDDWNRSISSLPIVMLQARGPGAIALSDNHAGEIVALPLQRGQQMWAHQNRFLCATGNVSYSWDLSAIWYELGRGGSSRMCYPMGESGDIFHADGGPGLVLLHSPGNTFIRDLDDGESIVIRPHSLLYRDLSVHAGLHLEYPRMDLAGGFAKQQLNYHHILARLTGPGRVAVQSVFQRPEDNGLPIGRHTEATTSDWTRVIG
jgi:uncharacterized protein (AIM24 family)